MAKVIKGIKFGGNSLPGAQTIGRQLAQQFNMRGGLANAVDISAQNPNEWLAVTNAELQTSTNSFNSTNTYLGGITGRFRLQNTFFNRSTSSIYSNTNPNFAYLVPPSEVCVASLEVPDSTVFSGTGTGSYGSTGTVLNIPATDTTVATITTPSNDATNFITNNISILTTWIGSSNFSSGFIKIGSNSSNYYQWNLTAPASDGATTLNLVWSNPSSTTGTPVISALTYVVISLTATAGGVLNVAFGNVQLGSLRVAALNVWPYDSVSSTGSGTVSTINAISVGDKAIQMVTNSIGTLTALISTSPKNLTSTYVFSPNTIIGLDTNWTNNGNFSSGFIKIGSDSSNYYQWPITSPGTDGNTILKFNWSSPTFTTGTPNKASISYIVIDFSATSGGSLTVQCSNLRIGAFSDTSLADQNYSFFASNISYAFPYVSDSNVSHRQIVMQCRNSLYIQTNNVVLGVTDSNQAFSTLKTGFTATVNNNINLQNCFYATTFPKLGVQNQNLLYWVNGNDGIFSYDNNAPIGSQFTQISQTAYKYIVSHKNYMWYAGDPNNPNTLVPSILSTPGTLDTINAITLNNQDGQNVITGLVSMDDYLIIFRTKDIWIMLGTTTGSGGDISIQKTLSTIGAMNQRCVARAGGLAYHFDGNSIYEFNGSTSQQIGQKINFLALAGPQTTGITNVGTFFDPSAQEVYFSINRFDQNNPTYNPVNSSYYANSGCLVYNIALKSFHYLGGTAHVSNVIIGGFSFTSPYDKLSHFYTYGINLCPNDGYSQSLVSANVGFNVVSCWNNLQSPYVQKDPDQIRLFISSASGGTGTLNFYTDFNLNSVAYTTTFTIPVTGSSSGFVDLNIGPGCQGHAFAIGVSATTTSTGNIVYSGYGITWTVAEVI